MSARTRWDSPFRCKSGCAKGGKARKFILDTFRSQNARSRAYLAPGFDIEKMMEQEGLFSRNIWAFLSLELWQQQFHDVHRQTI